MPDVEKVVNALEWLLENMVDPFNDFMLFDYDGPIVLANKPIIEDALALLKAQEPVEPTIDIRHGKSMWRCGSCASALQPNQIHTKFCFNCGKAVKWE